MPLAGEGTRPFAIPDDDPEQGKPRVLVGEGGEAPEFRVGDGWDDLRSLVVQVQNLDLNAQPAAWKEKSRACGDHGSEGFKKWSSLSQTEKGRMMGRFSFGSKEFGQRVLELSGGKRDQGWASVAAWRLGLGRAQYPATALEGGLFVEKK